MKAIQIISQDLFDKVRSRFSNLEMGDETGAVTIDPADARFFDFDFVQEGNDLGRVSISLNELGSLKVYYSQGITENQDDPVKRIWYNFLKEMRFFAMRRLLRFDTRDIAKTNLDKNDFQHLATTQGPKEQEDMTNMNESKWNNKSSKKTSRAIRGKTEVIVRHANPVDEEYSGSRSQKKNIKAIFIQNHDGERFKYPFIHPAGAFAMAQHVDHGGAPHDPAGKAIIKMSEDIAQLQEFQRKIQRASLHDDATGITERAVGRLQELKSQIESLGKRHHYESWMAEFNEPETGEGIMELDAVTMEDYKSKFTQTSFQEELSSYFPLLHRIMSETNRVDLEDYVKEEKDEECEKCNCDPCECDDSVKESAFSAFEAWADATEAGTLTPDQIQEFKNALAELPQGPTGPELELGAEGETAWQFFQGLGIDDPKLENMLRSADPEADPFEVLKLWNPTIAQDVLPSTELASPAEPASEPTSPAPEVGASQAEPPAMENEEHDGTANSMMSKEGMIKEVAKIVKSFYNATNESVGPFRGHEGILIDVEKTCTEKFGDVAGQQARQIAEAFMEKLTKDWENRHGKSAQVGGTQDSDDGLARLKELLGNVKAKVEGIGDRGTSGDDFNNNIMSAEDGPDKSQVPAYLRKARGETELSLKDLEKERTKSPTTQAGLVQRKKEVGISELSKNTLKSYSKEAGHDVYADQRDAEGARYQSTHSKKHGDAKQGAAWDDEAQWLDNRAEKRAGGIAKATTKIAQKHDESAFEDIMRLAGIKK